MAMVMVGTSALMTNSWSGVAINIKKHKGWRGCDEHSTVHHESQVAAGAPTHTHTHMSHTHNIEH